MHYEVIVIGGGPAGVAAAVSAARQGCTTALLEENGFLGGTATGGLVLPISGFFHKERQVVGGIGWEVVSGCWPGVLRRWNTPRVMCPIIRST